MYPLTGRRTLRDRETGSPFGHRPDRPRCEPTAAIRADVEKHTLNALSAKGALVGTNPRERRRRWQRPVAAFAVGSQFQCHLVPPADLRPPLNGDESFAIG